MKNTKKFVKDKIDIVELMRSTAMLNAIIIKEITDGDTNNRKIQDIFNTIKIKYNVKFNSQGLFNHTILFNTFYTYLVLCEFHIKNEVALKKIKVNIKENKVELSELNLSDTILEIKNREKTNAFNFFRHLRNALSHGYIESDEKITFYDYNNKSKSYLWRLEMPTKEAAKLIEYIHKNF